MKTSDNYDNDANATNADACKLMGDLESMSKECIGPDCQPFSRYNSTSKTNLIGMDFTDSAGDRHTCYSNDSYTNFLKKIRPGTNMQSNNINLCDIGIIGNLDFWCRCFECFVNQDMV